MSLLDGLGKLPGMFNFRYERRDPGRLRPWQVDPSGLIILRDRLKGEIFDSLRDEKPMLSICNDLVEIYREVFNLGSGGAERKDPGRGRPGPARPSLDAARQVKEAAAKLGGRGIPSAWNIWYNNVPFRVPYSGYGFARLVALL